MPKSLFRALTCVPGFEYVAQTVNTVHVHNLEEKQANSFYKKHGMASPAQKYWNKSNPLVHTESHTLSIGQKLSR